MDELQQSWTYVTKAHRELRVRRCALAGLRRPRLSAALSSECNIGHDPMRGEWRGGRSDPAVVVLLAEGLGDGLGEFDRSPVIVPTWDKKKLDLTVGKKRR